MIEILSSIREHIDDPNMYKDVNYCIKSISSGKLYEANVEDLESGEANEALNWVRNFRGNTRKKSTVEAQAIIHRKIRTLDLN